LPSSSASPGRRESPRNFCLAGKTGCAIPFDGESFAGGAGGARLPARAELGPLLASDRAKASTACPTCGLTANSTTSGVLILQMIGGPSGVCYSSNGSTPPVLPFCNRLRHTEVIADRKGRLHNLL
jgi:hypothetical protein